MNMLRRRYPERARWEERRPYRQDWYGEGQDMNLPLDVTERRDEFVVRAALPGISPEDIEIIVADNILTIRGESQFEQEDEDEQYMMREHRYGTFSRSITLPASVDVDGIEANCNYGVVSIHLPKAEVARSRRIPVRSDVNQPTQFDSSTSGWTEGQQRGARQPDTGDWAEGQRRGPDQTEKGDWAEGQERHEQPTETSGWTEGQKATKR